MSLLRGRRKGSETLLAEMVMIVTSLIATLALNGFLFGTMTAYAHPAEVTASSASCQAAGGNLTCSISLLNLGTQNATTQPTCSIGGAQGSLSGGGLVPAGGSKSVKCSVTGHAYAPGSLISGNLALTSGTMIYFTARI